MKISKRLEVIASFLTEGSRFADIGTDHAYLPCYICLNDQEASAIAGEKNKGPYEQAKKNVQRYQLEERIEVRLGDGLEVLEDAQITELIIAGMGGPLIVDILQKGKQYLHTVQKMVLQPNVAENKVREWLLENDYMLTNETMVKENDHIYEILVATQPNAKKALHPYSAEQLEKELFFGPFLFARKTPIFYEKWQKILRKKRKVLRQLQFAKKQPDIKKIQQFKKEVRWIEEVLENE